MPQQQLQQQQAGVGHEALTALTAEPGVVIADSGCRAAVGGIHWHEAHQACLKRHNMTWETEPESEFYRFGAGPVVESKVRYRFPITICGETDYITMSCVEGPAADCPGLASPADLKRW